MSNITLPECVACETIIEKIKNLCDYFATLSKLKSKWISTFSIISRKTHRQYKKSRSSFYDSTSWLFML